MLLSDRTIISQENIALFNKSTFRLLTIPEVKFYKFYLDVFNTYQTMTLIVTAPIRTEFV